jgi:hypothetical protein
VVASPLLSVDALVGCGEVLGLLCAYLSSDRRFIHRVPDIVLSQKAVAPRLVVVRVLLAQSLSGGRLRYLEEKNGSLQ